MVLTSVLSAALFASTVAAHGAVTSYVIGGTTYPGYTGFSPQSSPPSIQRQWPNYDPIYSVTSSARTCNGGTSAALSAEVAAGGTVTAKWAQWTHAQGPVTVYLFRCSGAFSSCSGSGNGWFKIDEEGLISPPLTGEQWGTGVVLRTLQWTSTIPSNLAPGNYLIRHELLALHQSNTPQFYPECAQIVVTGSGTASPSGSYLTSIPGDATANDPGVLIDIYSSTATTYRVPGPPVWGGQSGNPPQSSQPPQTTTARPPTTTTARPPTTTTSPPVQTGGGTVQRYGQCGGQGWTGATACVSPYTCQRQNDYYSQCL